MLNLGFRNFLSIATFFLRLVISLHLQHVSSDFQIGISSFQMSLATLVNQPVSILREKSWKVVTKCKIVKFFNP